MVAASEGRAAATERRPRWRLFVAGFAALLPLWTAAIPSGIAYGVVARDAGLSPAEVQLMSVVVFSAAAQIAAVAQIEAGASLLEIAGTAVALNIQLLMIGVVIQRQLRLRWLERAGVAAVLTDGAFGIAAAREPLRLPVLLGAGTSMFTGWNLGTALGIGAGRLVENTGRTGIDLVVPLAFLAVLVPLLRTRSHLAAALVAAGVVLLAGRALPPGAAVLAAGMAGALVGAVLQRRTESLRGTQEEPGA